MKFKKGVILTQNGDENILVPAGEAGEAFSGMIKMNGTAGFLAGLLQQETDEDRLTAALCAHYDVSEDEARKNVQRMIKQLETVGLLEQ